jgi:mannose-6-phosphate isomerase-like protein (cupin superfamily)
MKRSLETYSWDGEGYKPLVFTMQWMAALLNWEPIFDPMMMSEIERHNHSDEVFVLLQGRAIMFTQLDGAEEFNLVELEPEKIYNVPAGVWHNLLASRDFKFLIVENKGTDTEDTEIRKLNNSEIEVIKAKMPDWV